MQEFKVLGITQQDDGFGGFYETKDVTYTSQGYLDLISGTNDNTMLNAKVEQSTHILITEYFDWYKSLIDDKKSIQCDGKEFSITYVDNPVGLNHHLEIYLQYDKSLGEAHE